MTELQQLEIELEAIEQAISGAFFRVTANDLNTRRAEVLGKIKELTHEDEV